MDAILERISGIVGSRVLGARPLGGGCIADSSRVDTELGSYFVKTGRGDVASSLSAEEDGLRFLGNAVAGDVFVPEVVCHVPEEATDPAILVLEWIDEESWSARRWETLGSGVAALHEVTAGRYGHRRDNFIGRLPQENGEMDRWPDFFRSRRLEPQVEMARSMGIWRSDWNAAFESLCRTLDERLPDRPAASALHGDLWSGNVLSAAGGRTALIDPAVYSGDRETDLAMARLFGGFGDRFFAAYDETWPLEHGWEEREPIYRLYHLIDHMNHFGRAYAGAVDRTLRMLVTG